MFQAASSKNPLAHGRPGRAAIDGSMELDSFGRDVHAKRDECDIFAEELRLPGDGALRLHRAPGRRVARELPPVIDEGEARPAHGVTADGQLEPLRRLGEDVVAGALVEAQGHRAPRYARQRERAGGGARGHDVCRQAGSMTWTLPPPLASRLVDRRFPAHVGSRKADLPRDGRGPQVHGRRRGRHSPSVRRRSTIQCWRWQMRSRQARSPSPPPHSTSSTPPRS